MTIMLALRATHCLSEHPNACNTTISMYHWTHLDKGCLSLLQLLLQLFPLKEQCLIQLLDLCQLRLCSRMGSCWLEC